MQLQTWTWHAGGRMEEADCQNSLPPAGLDAAIGKMATKLNAPSLCGPEADGVRTLSRSQQGQRLEGTEGFSAGVCCFSERCMQQDFLVTGAGFRAGAGALMSRQHQPGGSASSRLEANTSVETERFPIPHHPNRLFKGRRTRLRAQGGDAKLTAEPGIPPS